MKEGFETFKCGVCGDEFTTKAGFYSHFADYHNKPKYSSIPDVSIQTWGWLCLFAGFCLGFIATELL